MDDPGKGAPHFPLSRNCVEVIAPVRVAIPNVSGRAHRRICPMARVALTKRRVLALGRILYAVRGSVRNGHSGDALATFLSSLRGERWLLSRTDGIRAYESAR